MTPRNGGELTFGQLRDAARDVPSVSPEDFDPGDYAGLREAMGEHITECRWCGSEFINGWSEEFCTDQCEVDHINEFHRD